jgi:hypothetical protein
LLLASADNRRHRRHGCFVDLCLIGGGRACDGSGGSLSFLRALCWWKTSREKAGKCACKMRLLRRLSILLMEWALSPDHLRPHIF